MTSSPGLVTVSLWQTLIEEAHDFHRGVQGRRGQILVDGASLAGVDVSIENATAAYHQAAHEVEQAYLAGRPATNMWRVERILELIGCPMSSRLATDIRLSLEASHSAEGLRVVDGAKTMIEGLRSRYQLAVLSDSWMTSGDQLRAFLKASDLLGYFDQVRISDETGRSKAAGDAFGEVADAAGVPLGSIVHVGDVWQVDGVNAVAAGCRGAVVVGYPSHPIPGANRNLTGEGIIRADNIHSVVTAVDSAWDAERRISD